jgi:membrane associated rhomboid family serine protease
MHSPFVNERAGKRWRWWLADLRSARTCWILGALFAGIHGLVVESGSPDWIFLRLGLSSDHMDFTIIWRSLTYAFIHGNPGHLFVNLAGLLLVGSRVERIGGPATVRKVFVVGAIAGGLAQLALAPPAQQGTPLVGASGGVAALLLWLTTASPDSRTWPLRVSGRNLGRGVVLAEAGFLVAGWWVPGMGLPAVAHACHLGGALAGAWLARRLLRPGPSLDDLKRQRARRESADGPG